MSGADWRDWHHAYDDPDSSLSRRLQLVRGHVADVLDAVGGQVRVLSLCAGDGRDLLGVLADHPAAGRVRALLVELDPVLASVAATRAAEVGTEIGADVEVRVGDAGSTATFADFAPVDLLMLCGIFGNITPEDVRRTVHAARGLCRPGATVVWTRSRGEPDLVPAVAGWFAEAGFEQLALSPPEQPSAVGAHRLTAEPDPVPAESRLFTFVREPDSPEKTRPGPAPRWR